jgi:hypothetical protein
LYHVVTSLVCYAHVCGRSAAVLPWIDKRVVEALKASLAERTIVQYSSQVTQLLLFVFVMGVWICTFLTGD